MHDYVCAFFCIVIGLYFAVSLIFIFFAIGSKEALTAFRKLMFVSLFFIAVVVVVTSHCIRPITIFFIFCFHSCNCSAIFIIFCFGANKAKEKTYCYASFPLPNAAYRGAAAAALFISQTETVS